MRPADRAPSLHALRSLAQTKFLRLGDLQPGDLLFALDPTSLKPTHVSIVTSKHATGAVRTVHLVDDRSLSGLHENDVVPERLVVMRCENGALAKRAAELATRWAEYSAPYARHRAAIAQEHERAHSAAGTLVATHRRLFEKSGKFRAIKYAARRNGPLIYPSETDARIGGNRGMFCSMFVAVCFQVAGLENLVDAAPDGVRVADKQMTPGELRVYTRQRAETAPKEDVRAFTQYLHNLNDVDPYKLGTGTARFGRNGQRRTSTDHHGQTYRPSLDFWKGATCTIGECTWAAHITSGMMLDAKVIYPEGLLECLRDDPRDWREMGILTGDRLFSESPHEKGDRMKAQQKKIGELFRTQ